MKRETVGWYLSRRSPSPQTGQFALQTDQSPDTPLQTYLRDPGAIFASVAAWVRVWGVVAAPLLLAAVLLLLWGWRRWQRRCHERFATDARLITVLAPPAASADGAGALWANLAGLLRPSWHRLLTGQPHLVWEYVFTRSGIAIQVWVPGVIPQGMVEHAIEAAWPGARTRTCPASAPIPTEAPVGGLIDSVGGELRLRRGEALPIRTAFPADPLRSLLGAPVGLGRGEQAVVQVLARPVAGRRIAKVRRAARMTGTPPATRPVSLLLDLITPHSSAATPKRRPTVPTAERQGILEATAQDRVIVSKLRGAMYETRIRYAVTVALDKDALADPGLRAALHNRLRGRAHAIAAATAAFTEHNYYRRKRLRRPLPSIADRDLRRGDLLSVAELAVLAHLPWDPTLPGVQRAGAQAVPPPADVATEGPDVKPIAASDSGPARPIGLRIADARHHIHIIGATGSGKSELMAGMILNDAEAGRGVVVVDPKGDLVTDVMMRLPVHAGRRVILFDADSRAAPPILNPLEGDDAARAVDNLVGIFSRIYASSWGYRTEDILRSGLLTLRALAGPPLVGPATLADLPKLLGSSAFRAEAVDHLHDEILTGFWAWYDDLSPAARAQIAAPLMNKLRGFLLRPFVRAAIAGGASTVNVEDILNNRGICLVRIARDALGTETARLVGSIVVARTWQAATRRARVPQSQRPDASLYIDEAHNFLNMPYPLEDMLAEARGYRLSIVLAHQYLGQLPGELAEGISANARTKIFFTASPEDARHLAKHTAPRLTEHDLSHLGAFQVAIRPVVRGTETSAFTGTTHKLPPPILGRAKQIRTAANINARPRTTPDTARLRPQGTDPRRAT
ncbi:type IV secretory system conjugative DNA transfer family protein [Streptodolium elevatio]|uniref:Type IV secretion system DNA-binding domain-containing protein n=1 Tax=Streptodolium elevatio TaxID=3157996 RepID=A0ABV3DAF3_9ACTN